MKLFRILPILLVVMLFFSACGRNGAENVSVASGKNTITIVLPNAYFYKKYSERY